ncbi:metabolite traffic protein EboE [Luteolibacter ambystomatis]|uniref:Metabolite traffic protein EboE n=1 Tax=Luteolibacter ambystomatis TaxID=2824561 RepID=A0A975IZG2_9BACT|nr:metabolite traffic protein EboE [Luteolibacter ambystomatis]QUE51436.1 metabolite traffic protein EboE [Luteolibacter ambystomatis]
MRFGSGHLAYCTNIHPAESWADTFTAISTHTMAVRDSVGSRSEPYAIGLRLAARAAKELLEGTTLEEFKRWLESENAYVFTINGFPYGDFHTTRVKEKVFQPDWATRERLDYTKDLFTILAAILPEGVDGSVSTLPGSHKTFHAEEIPIFAHLEELALFLDELSEKTGRDFHLGLEPEPLGHFENTAETLRFFERMKAVSPDPTRLLRRLGINYDACHFALQYEDARTSLDALIAAGLRISKIHLSSAIALDPRDPEAVRALAAFDEPIYFHQVLARQPDGGIRRFVDLPDGLAALQTEGATAEEWRVHFHIPLDAEPAPPLRSTRQQVRDVLAWRRDHPDACTHYEIETYTWGVLPQNLHRPVVEQIAAEYRWVLGEC